MTAVLLWLPLLAPAAVAAVARARPGGWTRLAPVGVAAVVLACGLTVLAVVRTGGPVTTAGGVLRADALAAYLLLAVGAVAVTALWGGLAPRSPAPAPDPTFVALVALFLGAMSLAVLADNLGVLWVGVESTTIATAFLVSHNGGRAALEAAWKYVLLGSVGVAIALLGLVILYAAARAAGDPTLSWVQLSSGSVHLDPHMTRVAVALAALGFATKAGLAPMHSWLPDAHSQAPVQVSGLMSGVLLSVAFSAILRVQAISDVVLGPGFMRGLLVAAGLLSLATAAALMLAQRDYKRLLAYSSIEHMGLLALGAAAGGPLATAAVLLHVLGHGLVKASMFVVAGRILAAEGTSRINDVRDLLRRRPGLAAPFLAGGAALLGLPPFVLFFTEVGILVAGWQRGLGWAVAVALVLLLVVFTGFTRHLVVMGMASGRSPSTAASAPVDAASGPAVEEPPRAQQVPVALSLGLAGVLGFAAWPLAGILTDAVGVLGGAR